MDLAIVVDRNFQIIFSSVYTNLCIELRLQEYGRILY